LHAGAVDALDEDAFDVGGFGGTRDPDDVGVVGHGGEGVGNGTVDGLFAHHGDVGPGRERGQTIGGGVFMEEIGQGKIDSGWCLVQR